MATQPTQADVAEMMSAGAVVLEKIPTAAPLSMGRTAIDIDLPTIPPEDINLASISDGDIHWPHFAPSFSSPLLER